MNDLVQTRRKPPILVPLANPLALPKERLQQRVVLITNYAERYRQLDDIEAREILNLKHILATGTERPKGGNHLPSKVWDEREIRNALAALL